MVFFYLVTTGWIFDISLCENSFNQSINQSQPYNCATAAVVYIVGLFLEHSDTVSWYLQLPINVEYVRTICGNIRSSQKYAIQ